jgi:hypothetical protein
MHTFPDFDKDVRRPFAVAEDCYDCGEFYAGCNGRPASPPTCCRDYLRLPDVKAGTTGQTFPPSRMGGRRDPRLYRETAADDRGSAPATAPAPAPARKQRPRHTGPRLCGCGATLPKGKRLCDACRAQKRRQAKSGYMRTYMQQRRSGAVDADSDVPSTHAARPFAQGCGDERPSIGLRA